MNIRIRLVVTKHQLVLSLCTLLLLSSLPDSSLAFTNRITQTAAGSVSVAYPLDANAYYTLHVTTNLSGQFHADAMQLGDSGTGAFLRSTAESPFEFYSVERTTLPLALDNVAGADRDGDGIDDYYELTHPPLNPLDPSDAKANTNAYWNTLPLYAYFATSASSVSAMAPSASLPFYLTKPYNGTVRYQISGTSVAGSDFTALSGSVSVNGMTGVIPISLVNTPQIESARSIVVTLQMETNKGPYTLSKPTAHRLDIIEGDNGVYAGAMGFTNGVFFGPQPMVMAVRSAGGSAGTAYFDTSGSSFFTQPIAFPIQFTGPDGQFQFSAPATATGSTYSTNLARTLNWSLTFTGVSFTNNVLLSPFTLSVQGMTAGAATLQAKGNLVLGLAGK